jgi:hypothetical protein
MNEFPTPLSTNIRRHPSGLASVELVMNDDQVHACQRCENVRGRNCKAESIEDGSPLYVCRHRIRQKQLNAFLFGSSPTSGRKTETAISDPSDCFRLDDAASDLAERMTAKFLNGTKAPTSEGGYGFTTTAASLCFGDCLGHKVDFFFWSEDDWDAETQKPLGAWRINGGGRIWGVIAPQRDRPCPLKFRPWPEPPAYCGHPHWIDLEADLGGMSAIYRVSVWPEESPPVGSVYHPHRLKGNGRFAWVDMEFETYSETSRERTRLANRRPNPYAPAEWTA